MITVTDKAAEMLKDIIHNQQVPDSSVRVFIRGRCGCGAVHYAMGFDANVQEEDEALDLQDLRFLIDKDTAAVLEGATIDYTESQLSRGFVINNPNAQSGCTCGGGGH